MPPPPLVLLARPALTQRHTQILAQCSICTLNRRPRFKAPRLTARPPPHPVLINQSRQLQAVNFHASSLVRRREKHDNDEDGGTTRDEVPAAIRYDRMTEQEDFGVFPATALIVSKSDWPSWWKWDEFNKRRKMETQRLKLKRGEIVSLWAAKWSQGYWTFVRKSLGRRGLNSKAVALYEQMNRAIADGDIATLERITMPSIVSAQTAAIKKRSSNIKYEWSFDGTPKATVWTNRATPFPKLEGTKSNDRWLQQAVVRIQGKQVVQMSAQGRDGAVLATGQAMTRDIDEMVVLQKVLWDADGGGAWKIWGTTQATSVDDWDDVVAQMDEPELDKDAEATGKGVWQRLTGWIRGMTGRIIPRKDQG